MFIKQVKDIISPPQTTPTPERAAYLLAHSSRQRHKNLRFNLSPAAPVTRALHGSRAGGSFWTSYSKPTRFSQVIKFIGILHDKSLLKNKQNENQLLNFSGCNSTEELPLKSQCRAVSYFAGFMGPFLPLVEINFTLNRYQKHLRCHSRLLFSAMERQRSIHQLKSRVTIDREKQTKCLLRAPSLPSHGFSDTLPDACGLLPTSVAWHRFSTTVQAAQHPACSPVRKPQLPSEPQSREIGAPSAEGKHTSFEMEIGLSNVLRLPSYNVFPLFGIW